jgi:hypothetical protein
VTGVFIGKTVGPPALQITLVLLGFLESTQVTLVILVLAIPMRLGHSVSVKVVGLVNPSGGKKTLISPEDARAKAALSKSSVIAAATPKSADLGRGGLLVFIISGYLTKWFFLA